ncbi:MAG: hypothetical protein QM760_01035 [Nibricoccus sp.]
MPTPTRRTAPTIERVETLLLDLPTIRPACAWPMATMHRQTLCLVRLTAPTVWSAWARRPPSAAWPMAQKARKRIKTSDRQLFCAAAGRRRDATRSGRADGAAVSKHVVGNHFAKCAVETALLDAQGKRLGVPLSASCWAGACVESLPVLWTLASRRHRARYRRGRDR